MRFSARALDPGVHDDLAARLKSIEGQARGIREMLDSGRDCDVVMDQLSALRAASHAVSMRALEAFVRHCLVSSQETPEQTLGQLMSVVTRFTR